MFNKKRFRFCIRRRFFISNRKFCLIFCCFLSNSILEIVIKCYISKFNYERKKTMNILKKNRKAILFLALVICTIASVFAVMSMPAAAAESADSKLTFATDRYYVMDKAIASDNGFTFEAEVSVPYEYKAKRSGVIIGNYDDHAASDRATGTTQSKALSVELVYESSMMKVRVYTRHAGNVKFNYNLNNDLFEADGTTPKYAKIAVSVDPSLDADHYVLYVNGEQKATASRVEPMLVSGCFSDLETMWIGADPRKDNAQYFKGSIKNLAVYDDIRTADEVAADAIAFAPDTSDANLLCAYDLTDLEVNEGYLNDLSSNGNNAKNPNWKPDGIGREFSVNDNLLLSKAITEMPQTFEAVIYAPTKKADGTALSRPGVIIGNYHLNREICFNFEIHSNGMATVYLDQGKGAYSTKIADVRCDSGFVHIAIVRELNVSSGAKYTLYVDGQYVTSTILASDTVDLDIAAVQATNKLQLGGDARTDNARWFQGRMKDVALYSEPLTAEEVMASYKNGVGTVKNKDNGLILHLDMNEYETPDYVKDVSGNDHHATQGGVSIETFNQGRGFSVEDTLYVQKKLDVMPKTYEALVLVPSNDRAGVILGNYGGSSCINFEIHGSSSNPRVPSLYITDENGNTFSDKFAVNLTPNTWVHLVITHETSAAGATFKCYVDGALAGTLTSNLSYEYDLKELTAENYLRLGGDSRSGNVQNYKGRIKNVALYSNVLTAEEVKGLYENGMGLSREDIILAYDLTKPENQTGTTIIDETGNGYNIGSENVDPFYERTEAIGDYDYAFAIVGDTQKLVYQDVNNGTNYVSYIYDWLVANKTSKKIGLVMGVGDITEKNTAAEYERILPEFQKLADAGMLYSITPGNHDGPDAYTRYNSYFSGVTSLTKNISGYYNDDSSQVANYYIKTTIEGEKYMIFSLQYGANDDILAWAGNVCDENKDYKVIMTTHAYMFRDGTTLDAGDVVPPNSSDKTTDDTRNNGDMMWEEFVSQHENIVLTFSGHDPCPNVVMRQDLGINGNVVSQFLVDFQTMDGNLGYETGMVAMLYISKNGNVKVEYISTYRTAEARKTNPDAQDMLYKEMNQFSFNMYEIPENLRTEYGVIPYEYMSEAKYPLVVFQNGEFKGAYSVFASGTESNCAIGRVKQLTASTPGLTAEILLRSNITVNATLSNQGQILGDIIIDLSGYTMTQSNTYLFNGIAKNWKGIDDSSFTIINGNIVLNTHGLAQMGAYSNGYAAVANSSTGEYKTTSFIFKDVNISLGEGATLNNLLGNYSDATNIETDGCIAGFEYIFDSDCVIDITNAPSGFTLFGANDNKISGSISSTAFATNCIVNVKIEGGRIIAANSDFVLADINENNNSSVTFDLGTNGYTVLSLDGESEKPSQIMTAVTSDGVECVFVKVSENDGYANYSLYPKAILGYKIKTSVTLYSNFVYNIYIPKANVNSFTINGATMEYEEIEMDGVTYYHVAVNLPAGETLSDIKVCVKLNSGSTTVDANWTLNVLNYTKSILAGEYDNVTKTLMKDMLVYASAAHTYFENTEAVSAKLSEIATLLEGYTKAMPTGEAKQPTGTTYFKEVTVNLDKV
ncbi:MAG: hypothetical protein E7673_04870, partial [Ruminococcaceae bacterium]|nr:hypothetical protein [Oscillospiraceae bacterium]